MKIGIDDYVERVALKKNWVLNPDKIFVQSIIDGLNVNLERYGRLFCPCREAPEDPSPIHPYLCPCAVAPKDIERFGQCYCGLYLAPGKDPSEVTSIPDAFFESQE